jgi:hypothetical protein
LLALVAKPRYCVNYEAGILDVLLAPSTGSIGRFEITIRDFKQQPWLYGLIREYFHPMMDTSYDDGPLTLEQEAALREAREDVRAGRVCGPSRAPRKP